MEGISNDILVKDCSADLIMTATVYDYYGDFKKVSILIDSSNDWSLMTGENGDIAGLAALSFFGVIILRAIEHDINAKYFFMEFFQVISGTSVNLSKSRAFISDGKRYKMAKVNRDGSIEYMKEHEI